MGKRMSCQCLIKLVILLNIFSEQIVRLSSSRLLIVALL